MRIANRAALNLILGALAVAPLSAQTQVSAGYLNQAGVSLENSQVRFHFKTGSSGELEFDIVDLTANPAHAFRHRGDFPWLIEVLELADKEVKELDPSACGQTIHWTKTLTKLNLTWDGCRVDGDGPFRVRMTIDLPAGADAATWRLWSPSNSMDKHSFWSGRLAFSIEEQPSPTLERYLLDPLGYLTKDPALNLPTWALGTEDCPDPRLRNPVFNYLSQFAAYYDDQGRGLYLQGVDTTCTLPNSHFYKRIAGLMPRMDYAYGVWQDDVLEAGNGLDDVAIEVGRFQGDWIDAADRYKDWLQGTVVTSGGLLKDRTDLDDEILRMQQMIPLGVGSAVDGSYNKGANGNRHMWDAVIDYRGVGSQPVPLEHVTVWQFGTEWVEDEDCGVGVYAPKFQWLLNFANMEGFGIPFLTYILDHDFAYDADVVDNSPSGGQCLTSMCRCVIDPSTNDFFTTFEPVAMRALEAGANGNDFVPPGRECDHTCPAPPLTPVPNPRAKIEPGSSEWLQRCTEVANELKGLGVDGFFLDNLFPLFNEYCFSSDHGSAHEPGYGPYLQSGMADMASAFQGSFGWNFTEVAMEFYVGPSASMAGATSKADILALGTSSGGTIDNPDTVDVPLEAHLYHEYAISRPVNIAFPFTLDPAAPTFPSGALPISVLSSVSSQRAEAERGASYAIAQAVVNGSPLFCADTNALSPSPMLTDWHFDLPAGLAPPEAVRVLDMSRRLSWYRGIDGFHEFLVLGERRRDLPFVAAVQERDVYLRWLSSGFLDLELESVPDLVQGLWEDVSSGEIGLAVANHYSTAASGHQVSFDPADYAGVPNTYNVYRIQPNATYTGTLISPVALGLQGAQNIALPTIPAQDMVFLVFSGN